MRGPWVAAAYYPGNESPDRWTDDGWFRTGDIVTIAPGGSICIKERSKDLVKSGGEWISTVALETALMSHASIAEVVVIAAPHPTWGERPLAVVVPKPGCAPCIEDLRSHLAPHFVKWWLPDAVVCVESLPRTGTGKYQKNHVRETYREFFVAAASPTLPTA